MLFLLFTDEQLRDIFGTLGYELAPDIRRRMIDYYDPRTSHGSTLSHVAHAGVLAAIDPERSWERFLTALESDIGDIQGGTTREGIHMGVMAGTLDLIQHAYLGTEIRDDVLRFDPRLTDRLDGLSLPMQFRRTAHPRDARERRADRRRARGRGHRADPRRLPRRRPRPRGRAAVHVPGRCGMSFAGAILDVDGVLVDSPHERAWRDTLRELMDGDWRDIRRRTSYAPERFTHEVYQHEVAGKPRMSGARAALEHFGVPDVERDGRAVRRAQAAAHRRADRRGRVHGLPRRVAPRAAAARRRHHDRDGVLVQERGAVPARDPARHVRRRAGPRPRLRAPGHDAARLRRRRHLGARLRSGQAASGDLPGRRRRARHRAACVLRRRGRRGRHRGRRRRRDRGARGRAGRGGGRCSLRPARTSWSRRSTQVDVSRLPQGRLAAAAAAGRSSGPASRSARTAP